MPLQPDAENSEVASLPRRLRRRAVAWMLAVRHVVSLVRLRHQHGQLLAVPTHLTWIERLILYERARRVPAGGVIVELGSYLGGSTLVLALGARQAGAMVYAVDTWRNENMSEGPRDTFEEFCRNIGPLADRVTPLRGPTAEIARGFDRAVDLLFVDADHSYAGALDDFVHWGAMVRDGGWIVWHDIGWAEGVNRAALEALTPRIIPRICECPNMAWGQVHR